MSSNPPLRYLEFQATAGTAYQIQVVGTWTGPFTLQILATNPPVILSQPRNSSVSALGSTAFWVQAAGVPRPSFQWRFNGVALPDQTAPVLLLGNLPSSAAGTYSVIASNSGGVTESAGAILTFTRTNAASVLTALPLTNPGRVDFVLTGEAYRGYRIEASTNLAKWLAAYDFDICGGVPGDVTRLSIPRLSPDEQFVRVYPDLMREYCMAQLEQMDAASRLLAVEAGLPSNARVAPQDLQPYLAGGGVPACPAGGHYYYWTVQTRPTCSLSSACSPHYVPSP
jgi:hypothetical protein